MEKTPNRDQRVTTRNCNWQALVNENIRQLRSKSWMQGASEWRWSHGSQCWLLPESSGEAKKTLILGLSPENFIYLGWEVALVARFLKALQVTFKSESH